jgi:hypothetical protein
MASGKYPTGVDPVMAEFVPAIPVETLQRSYRIA